MVDPQKLKDLENQALSFPQRAEFISVHSQSTLTRANDFLKLIKNFQKQISDFFDPNIARLHTAHKEAKAQKSLFEQPLKKAEEIVKEVIRKYLVEQEALRIEAEEKARQEAEKRFEEARELERLGEKEKAEQIRKEETALSPALPPVVKAEGTHLTKRWTWEVQDISKIPEEYFVLDELKINALVRSLKGSVKIPGIRVFQTSGISTRIK